jgi:hypothetical protein
MFGALLGFFSSVYSKLMFTIYCFSAYEHWDHFMKITTNQKSHHERSLLRNICFNLVRCMANEVFREFVVGVPFTPSLWAERIIGVIVISIIVHYYFHKKMIERNCETWSYLFVAFGCSFGILWLNDLTQAELWSKGDLSKFMLYAFFNMLIYMFGDFIEDLLCRDLNVIGGPWHNWGFYWPPMSIAFIGYSMQYYFRTHDFFQHPKVAVAVVQNLNPVLWPKLAFGEQITFKLEADLLMVSNAIMMIAAVYYNYEWVKQIKRTALKKQNKKRH